MLNDMILAPSQACGAFRLVPLLRKNYRTDLRLGLAKESGFAVKLSNAIYTSYIPHAIILEWNDGSAPLATVGTQLRERTTRSQVPTGVFTAWPSGKEGRRLRFLPLHLAMEGLLAMHFGRTDRSVGLLLALGLISQGVSPRVETSIAGWARKASKKRLRVFEIHEGQVGVLVFVADALAMAFVTPHPDDYRALHDSLLQDFFGELIWQYAVMYPGFAAV